MRSWLPRRHARKTARLKQQELIGAYVRPHRRPFKGLSQKWESTSIETLSEEFSEIVLEMELPTEALAERSRGLAYNLEGIFETVNRDYFSGQMEKPCLSWNRIRTTRKFGHYEPTRDRGILSRTLDDPQVPSFVVEFDKYHELLHKQHGEQWVNDRMVVHSPAFRKDEQKFQQYQQARNLA